MQECRICEYADAVFLQQAILIGAAFAPLLEDSLPTPVLLPSWAPRKLVCVEALPHSVLLRYRPKPFASSAEV